MKKLSVSTSILALLVLSGCGVDDEDIGIVIPEPPPPANTPTSTVVFNPAAGEVSLPNDLLLLPGDDGFFDFTLNLPVADPSDFSDPLNALNVGDGWSTTTPFVIDFTVAAGVSIDVATAAQGIRIFEATLGLDQSVPECAAIPIPSAGCLIGDELEFGVDFIVSAVDADSLVVVPVRPFKAAQGHTLVVTSDLLDSSRNPVAGSETWQLVSADPATSPVPEALQSLQALVNTQINALSQVGISRDQISYAAAFTTHSVFDVMTAIKQFHVAAFAQTQDQAALPAITVSAPSATPTALETLGLVSQDAINVAVAQAITTAALPEEVATLLATVDFSTLTTCSGLLGASNGQFTVQTEQSLGEMVDPVINQIAQGVSAGVLEQSAPFCAVSVFDANISLPYFLATPTAENPLAPVNEFWTAACDSGIVLAGAPAEALAAATPGPNDALCSAIGLRDLQVGGQNLDRDRNVTRFNPLPQRNGRENGNEILDVQVTVPNIEVAAGLGIQLTMPENGWPVVILVHGITSQKEDMLAISGALSLAGLATIAIDQPLHGTRGFDINPLNPGDEINATTVSPTAFLNLGVLPTARDNNRQSLSDLLGLRLGLHAVVNMTGLDSLMLDASNVSVMGVSLGAINGGSFTSVTNQPLPGDLAPLSSLFSVQAASLDSPGGGFAQFLLDSPSFGPLVQALLTQASNPTFQALLTEMFPNGPSDAELVQAFLAFIAAASDEQVAQLEGAFAQFAFAAQTVVGPSDPINYFGALGDTTPVHVLTVIGDGGQNLPDQVIPPLTSIPLSGQFAVANQLGVSRISSSTQTTEPMGGHVLFTSGAHASSLSPFADPAVTLEMQTQVAAFLSSGGRAIPINNTSVVNN